MSANVTGKHLCNILNMDIGNYNVTDNTKVATVRPIYKKNPEMNYIKLQTHFVIKWFQKFMKGTYTIR